jgi:hypothetical protein
LLPVLLHELNNHTQLLAALGALARDPCGLGAHGDTLASAGRDVEELGWLLGLVAGGLGTDLLFERRERAGLAPLARLVRKALRREGRDLERADRALPELDPRLGWRAAWEIGIVLFAAGRASAAPLAFEIEGGDGALALDCCVAAASLSADLGRLARTSARGAAWSRFVWRAAPLP